MDKLGIFHTFTNVDTPEQNGRVEREMRKIVEAAKAEIQADCLDERLWAEAMNHAILHDQPDRNQQTYQGKVRQKPMDLYEREERSSHFRQCNLRRRKDRQRQGTELRHRQQRAHLRSKKKAAGESDEEEENGQQEKNAEETNNKEKR
ncbi:unnamed protein product, partial [Arctia plantaginis]